MESCVVGSIVSVVITGHHTCVRCALHALHGLMMRWSICSIFTFRYTESDNSLLRGTVRVLC